MGKHNQGSPKDILSEETLSDETCLVHDERYSNGAVSPPIYQSSLFTFENYKTMVERYRGEIDHPLYSRVDNPTVKVLQDKVAKLEGGEAATAFASGMAAISNVILSAVGSGDRIVCVNHVYPDTYRFLRGLCNRFGIITEFVDGMDIEAIRASLPGTKLLYLESPNTWVMQEQNLAAIAILARAQGVTTIVDNSWASPIFQKPLKSGIDIVVHSASKYISGHSDTVAGLVVANRVLIERMNRNVCTFLGGRLSAHEAAMVIRGLRTLPLRMQRHHESGLLIANRLAERAEVRKVYHPGLEQSSFSGLSGYGGLLSLELDDQINIPAFCDALSLFRLGVSWGGHDSLILPVEIAISQAGEHNSVVDFGVSPRIIRLFVGLEDPEDLWRDLVYAFAQAQSHQSHQGRDMAQIGKTHA